MEYIKNVRSLFRGKKIEIQEVDVDLGNGHIARFERGTNSEGINEGVMAVVLDENGYVCLIKQFQVGTGKRELVLPRGGIEDQRTPDEQMNIELQEEIGFQADNLELLTTLQPFSGYFQADTHLFLARGLSLSKREGDELEEIQLVKMPFLQAVEKIMRGEISDARTVAGILFVKQYLNL